MKSWIQVMGGCVMAAALVGLAGCGGDDGGRSGTGGDPALVGSWRMISMSVNGGGFFPPGTIGWDVKVKLNADGSASVTEVWQGDTESGRGGWSTTGNQLNLDVGSYDWTGPYTVSDSQFTLANVPDYDGEDHIGAFVFARQVVPEK